MRIQRTANAGVLLELDDKRILLDGVCNRVEPYLPTPEQIRNLLLQDPPDALVYTHNHPDHYDELFVSHYLKKAAGPVVGPADIPCVTLGTLQVGDIVITPVESRHIGKTDGCEHQSYVLQGSSCIWFMGDASVLQWQKIVDIPKPDMIIAPYGFFLGRGLTYCKETGAKAVVVLHMPIRENDPYHLWDALEASLANPSGLTVFVPEIGETLEFR